MNIDERLSLFHELINCNYAVDLWSYTPDLKPLSSTCPNGVAANQSIPIMQVQFSDTLTAYLKTGNRAPFMADTDFGLVYIFAFEYQVEKLVRIHAMGPVFTGRNSHLVLKKELDKKHFSIQLQTNILRHFEQIPIVPSTQLFQYTVMFHCCVTGERITPNDIAFPDTPDRDTASEVNLISEEHRGIWMAEQRMLQMFREGNPDYKQAIAHSGSLSTGVKYDTGDALRKSKNDLHVLLTLCSRAAIEGGLNPSIGYTLNDYYAQKLEECHSTSEIQTLSQKLMEDYIQRVQKARADSTISRQIQSTCEYISAHPDEKISIAELAAQAGYTEYYFSHKFKSETGLSVNDYVKKKKIEQAKLLLCASKKSIQEISTELGFGSRSYFSTQFQKATGLSPKEYREQNLKM